MASRSTMSARERDARSSLHWLLNRAEDFFHGSAIDMARRCGNPNCKCAADEEHKHRCLCLGQTRRGKTTTVYIPRRLEARVREGIENYRRAVELLEVINEEARLRLDKLKSKPGETAKNNQAAKKKKKKKPREPS